MERYEQRYPDNDAEYQRVTNYDTYIDPREFRFRVASIIFFIINAVFEIFTFYLLVRAIMNHEALSGPIFSTLYNLAGILLLGNALFGQKWRRYSFNVYIVVYELLPLVIFALCFITVSIGFSYFRQLIEERIEKEHLNATTVTILLILFFLLAALYHALAAWVFNSYKKLRSARDADF